MGEQDKKSDARGVPNPATHPIENLIWTDRVIAPYLTGTNGEGIKTPTILIPLEVRERQTLGGFYNKQKGLVYTPMGFSQRLGLEARHYEINDEKGLHEISSPSPNVTYLPLFMTKLGCVIGRKDPFKVYGIDGATPHLPLLLVSRTHNGYSCHGLFNNKGKQGFVISYHYDDAELDLEAVAAVMEELKQGTFRKPTWHSDMRQPYTAVVETPTNTHHKREKISAEPESLEEKVRGKKKEVDWSDPHAIKTYLDRHVIGQNDAKKIVSVAFSNYVTRVTSQNASIPKPGVLLIGPPGSGKTYLLEILAKAAGFPSWQIRLPGLTSEGYKGENLSEHFCKIGQDVGSKNPTGVVFLDEIDKLARDDDAGIGFGIALQRELIGIVEGNTLNGISTHDLLFVAAGAFQGVGSEDSLEKIASRRLQTSRVGFGAALEQMEHPPISANDVIPKDLTEYGLMQELVGRFPVVGLLHPLTNDEKVSILQDSESSVIVEYAALFKAKGFKLCITNDAFPAIVANAPEELGARGLRTAFETLFRDPLYNPKAFAKGKKIIIDSKRAEELLGRKK